MTTYRSMFSSEEISRICDTVASLANGYQETLNRYEDRGLEANTLDEIMADNGYEQCPNCEWYAECGELIPHDSDEPDGFCDNCRTS